MQKSDCPLSKDVAIIGDFLQCGTVIQDYTVIRDIRVEIRKLQWKCFYVFRS